jgi:prepilin-type N-terminal cleavage/methylation domain-containing protein
MRLRLVRQRPAAAPARARGRGGMTLVEVIVALVILAGAMIALARFIGTFSRTVNDSAVKAEATQLAAERLEVVKAIQRYADVDAAAVTETDIPGHRSFTRRTVVRRVGGAASDDEDYKIVTVIVTAPALRTPVKRTTVISEF